jgi:hypothetical protein
MCGQHLGRGREFVDNPDDRQLGKYQERFAQISRVRIDIPIAFFGAVVAVAAKAGLHTGYG